MQVSPRDRGDHRHREVGQAGSVSVAAQAGQDDVPGAGGVHPVVPGPQGLLFAERLGQVPPCDFAPVLVNGDLDHLTRIGERTALTVRSCRGISAIKSHRVRKAPETEACAQLLSHRTTSLSDTS